MPIPAGPGASAVTWAPTLPEVADYVPRLTVDTTTAGAATELGTFTTTTTPDTDSAQRIINGAVAGVEATIGTTLAEALHPLANTVAALRAAATMLRAYAHHTGNDLAIAAAYDARADAEMARLTFAIADAADGEVDGTDGALEILPMWSMPAAVSWGDSYL